MTKNTILKLLIVSILATASWILAIFVSEFFEPGSVWRHLVFGLTISSLALVLITVFYKSEKKIQKKKFKLSKHLKLFGVGTLWFAVPALVSLAIASFLGVVTVEAVGVPAETIGTILLVTILVALSEAIPEEIIFRGYIFSKLSEVVSRWVVIVLQAVIFTIFAFAIGALSDPLDASFIFTFGMVLGILRSFTGSVATSIGFHLACMTFQQVFTERWDVFTVSESFMLQTYIFGMIPLSAVVAYFVTKMLASNKSV